MGSNIATLRQLRRRDDTYPIKKGTSWALMALSILPVLASLFLGLTSRYSYRPIEPILFQEAGLFDYYATVTLVGTISSSIVAPLAGRLGDLLGRRNVLMVTEIIPIIGALLLGATHSLAAFTIGYSFVLMGATLSPLLISGIISDMFDKSIQPTIFSIRQSVNMLPSVFASLMGAMIADKIGVQPWFLVTAGIYALSLVIVIFGIPNVKAVGRKAAKVKFDWGGAILMQIPVVCLCIAVGLGGRYIGWLSPTAIALYAASVIGFIAFARHEKSDQVEEPFLDLSIFKEKNYTLCLLSMITEGPFSSIYQRFLALYLLTGVGFSATEVSFGYLFNWIAIVLSPLIGILLTRYKKYRLTLLMSAAAHIVGLSIVLIFFIYFGKCTIFLYILVSICEPLLLTFQVTPAITIISTSIDSDKIGIAMSMRSFLVNIGTAFVVAIFTAIYNAYGGDIMTAFKPMVIIGIIAGVIRFAITMFIDDERIKTKISE